MGVHVLMSTLESELSFESFALELGRQPARNIATVIDFLESRGFAKPNPIAPQAPDFTTREDA